MYLTSTCLDQCVHHSNKEGKKVETKIRDNDNESESTNSNGFS